MESDAKTTAVAYLNELLGKPDEYWSNNGDIKEKGNTC